MRRHARAVLLLMAGAIGGSASVASAQTVMLAGEPDVPEKAGKEMRAHRIRGSAPQIDGNLDDEVWTLAHAIDDLVQNEPDNMAPPRERTVVQIAYDDRYLYIAARCFMRDPAQITTALGRRDTYPPSDIIRISFDPRHDHLTAFVFHVNPAGVQHDNYWYDDVRSTDDYDAVWDVQTEINGQGWNAELRIPFSQMRFDVAPSPQTVWGFNFRRDVFITGEWDRWVPSPRGVQGFVSRFGHLVFEDRLVPPRRMEFLPYVTAGREFFGGRAVDERFDAGVDVRLGLGTSSTLAATFNPDFGQVEQDPAVLNLSVFETFFPEKRPFFLEDSRVFSTNFSTFPMFHSRRIGQRPGRLTVSANERVIDRPDQTTILAATKLTGKIGSWTYGGLSALTAAEYAQVEITALDGDGEPVTSRGERLIEPLTSYHAARVQRDLFRASSSVGAIATAVVRDGDRDAYTGGFDYNLRFNRNLYRLEGQWVGTRAPVAGSIRTGLGGTSRFNYSGKHLNLNASLEHFSRGFRNADIGFFSTRSDKTRVTGGIGGGQPDPWKAFRNIWFFSNFGESWNGDRLVFEQYTNVGMDMSFRNFSYVGWNIGRNFDVLDDVDTRGGPAIARPGNVYYNLFANSDSRKTWRLFWETNASRSDAGGWDVRLEPGLNLQPSTRLQTSLSAAYNFGDAVAQWIVNRDADGDGLTDHVYGRLRRDLLDITARATLSFTRDLTLQLFLQPFVAVGDYTDLRKLARPGSFEFTPVSLPNSPDFNRKSLRGNTVLRWEYRPGSTVFVVWNMSTEDTARPGEFSAWRDLRGAFGGDGSHVFMVKVNLWRQP